MPSADAAAELHRLIDGYKITQAIHVAAVLGVADHISAGRHGVAEIAQATGADPDALYRLLRALAAVGVLCEDDQRRFFLAPMGEALRSDAEYTLAPFATLTGQPYYWQAWGHLLHSVKTGRNAFRDVHGVGSWTYREQHPDQNAIFNAAMTANARRVDPGVARALAAYGCRRIADIGGNQGSLVLTMLRADPALHAVLFDQPHVVAAAGPQFEEAGFAACCEIIAGDMFEAVPAGSDAYILKFILHDWDDEHAVRVLRTCRHAMTAGARLFVVERLIGAPNDALRAKLSDLNMLVGPGGRERTADEFARLFAASDLRLDHVAETSTDLSLIVGAPA